MFWIAFIIVALGVLVLGFATGYVIGECIKR